MLTGSLCRGSFPLLKFNELFMDGADLMQRLEITRDDFDNALEATKDARAKRYDVINRGKYGATPPGSRFAPQFLLPTLEEIERECCENAKPVKDAFPLAYNDLLGYGAEVSTGYMVVKTRRDYVTHCPEAYVTFLYEEFDQIARNLGDLDNLIRRMNNADFSSSEAGGQIEDILYAIGKDLPFVIDKQLIPSFNARRTGYWDYNGDVRGAILVMEYVLGPVTLTLKQNGTQWIVEKTGEFNYSEARTNFLARNRVREQLRMTGQRHWTAAEVDEIVARQKGGDVETVRQRMQSRLKGTPDGSKD